MTLRRLPLRTILCTLFLATPCLAAAQASPAIVVGGGLSVLTDETSSGTGGAADIAWRVGRIASTSIGIVGDVSVNRFEGVTISSYLGGARFWWNGVRYVRPYAQVLVGVESCCDEMAQAFQVGGGADVAIPGPLAVRVAYEYRRAAYDQAVFNERRFVIGIAFAK
jgi:opacity protein-like surface antigen